MFIYRILGCAVPPLSSWVTGLMHSCCYGGGWQCVSQEKPRRRGKHGISIENIARDYTKNINHLNSWRCLCFLVQDLFQKSDQKLHVYDLQTCFPELFSLFGTAVQRFFGTKMSNSILNFISQEERNIQHFQFWTVEIVHCHIDGSAAQWHGPWTQHVNRSSHAMIFLMKGPNHAIAR